MTATRVILSHDIEEERFDCKVESLVLQKQFGHETQTLTVHLVFLSVHLEHRNVTTSVDLSARGVAPRTQCLFQEEGGEEEEAEEVTVQEEEEEIEERSRRQVLKHEQILS